MGDGSMTDEYDEMLDDIEKQEILKPTQFPIKEEMDIGFGKIESLDEIPRYKMTDDQEEDFDVNYRTPLDANIKDMIPKDYDIIDDNSIGPAGYFSQGTGRINVRSERYLKKAFPDRNPKEKQREILVHENIHKNWFDVFELADGGSKLKDLRVQPDYELQFLETAVMQNDTTPEEKKHYNEELDNLFDTRTKFSDSKKTNRHRKAVENRYPYNQQLDEGYAYFGGRFPNEVINPTTKVGKKLNRMQYKDAPIWGMEV